MSPTKRADRSTGDYRRLPPELPIEDTIATHDADPVRDPEGGRNTAHYEALRND